MTDHTLQAIITAWPTLSTITRQRIAQIATPAPPPQSPDAGKPWSPVIGIKTAEEGFV